jgi:hypothetical protein
MSTSLQKDLVMVAATEGNEGDDYGGTWRRLTVAGGPAGGGWAEQAGRPAGASVEEDVDEGIGGGGDRVERIKVEGEMMDGSHTSVYGELILASLLDFINFLLAI